MRSKLTHISFPAFATAGAVALTMTLSAGQAHAAVVAGTSFENETAQDDNEYDVSLITNQDADDGGGDSDPQTHNGDIVDPAPNDNDSTPAIMNSTVSSDNAGDLGFSATHYDTTDGNFDDADPQGVVNNNASDIASSDGSNNYQLGDWDDRLELTFDTVDLSGWTDVQVSIDAASDGGLETGSNDGEFFRADVLLDGASDVNVFRQDGSVNDFTSTTTFENFTASIPDAATAATLVVDSQSGAESLNIDDVEITGVPTPGALSAGLVLLGGMAMVRRRRAA